MNAAITALLALSAAIEGATGAPSDSWPFAGGGSATAAESGTALIALDDSRETLTALTRFAAAERSAGIVVLRADEISRRLRGAPCDCPADGVAADPHDPADAVGGSEDANESAQARGSATAPRCYRAPDEDALTKMLADARALEAGFADAEAEELRRQVIDVFARTPQPSARQRLTTGQAWLDLAAGFLANGDAHAGTIAAREGARHFGDTPLQGRSLSPSLQQAFADARAALSTEAHFVLHVRSTRPGTLILDGTTVGSIQHETTRAIRAACYRLWLQTESGELSLPYTVDLANGPVQIDVDPDLDRALRFTTPIQLACGRDECPAVLARLRRRLGVAKVIAVGKGPSGALEVFVSDAEAQRPAAPVAEALPFAFGGNARGVLDVVRGHPGVVASTVVTAVALGAATALGLKSRSQFAEAADRKVSQHRQAELNDRARTNGVAANVLFGVTGAAAVAAGILLVIEW